MTTQLPIENQQLPSSFRDPSGFLFSREGVLYRQVNQVYAADYDHLRNSGLYDRLVKAGLLVSHEECDEEWIAPDRPGFKVIRPERVPFISYPYEWSFSQLKDAALATLRIQKRALKAGMSLKDASAYNIQFIGHRPVLIDTLSFEIHDWQKPWQAYRQFCQHFLAPLALMAYVDVRLNQLFRVYIDGVPLDLASRLLPLKTRLNFGLFAHIHLHARAQARYSDGVPSSPNGRSMSLNGLVALVESLEAAVKRLSWKSTSTEWADYYNITNYTDAAFEHKKELVDHWVSDRKPGLVWDMGANMGLFSRIASDKGFFTVSSDVDPAAVEQNYLQLKSNQEKDILPLLIDLTNPSPDLGWANRERDSFVARGPADLVMALALIHHLAISNNVPLPQLVDFFAGVAQALIIEFIPKSDSQVQKLLVTRADIFSDYTVEQFESSFSKRFRILEKVLVRQSERILYLMEAK